jgi:hypothetical protein
MKNLSFLEFARLCSEKRVVCQKSDLRADFDKNAFEQTQRVNKLTNSNLSFESDLTVYVGGDNDREGYEITENTYNNFWISDDGKTVSAEHPCFGAEFFYSVTEWKKC